VSGHPDGNQLYLRNVFGSTDAAAAAAVENLPRNWN